MKNIKEDLSLKSFNFFFRKLNEALPNFQKVLAKRMSGKEKEFSEDEQKQIFDTVCTLYLRSVNEFKNMELIFEDDPTPYLEDPVSVEILIGVGQMIVSYENSSLGGDYFNEF